MSKRLFEIMKMLSISTKLGFAPIKFIKTGNDVIPILQADKYHYFMVSLTAVVLSAVYLKVKVYDALALGSDFFLYIRSLATFVEIICFVGNMMCCNFGARKMMRVYKKIKKIIKNNFLETDYKIMHKTFVMEMVIGVLFFLIQTYSYSYFIWSPVVVQLCILDSNIELLITTICLTHYNITKILQICLEKLLQKSEETINSKQLEQIWTSYLEIHNVVRNTNDVFGFSLSCSLAVICIYCLTALFGICSFASNKSIDLALINVVWFSIEMTRLLAVVVGTSYCEVTARKLNVRLGCYKGEDNHLEEVIPFSSEMLHF